MANENKISPEAPPMWKVAAAVCMAAGALSVLIVGGGLGRDQIFLDDGQKIGFALGSGAGAALIVWIVAYFLLIKRSTRTAKWLSFLVLATFGASLVYFQT
ncbi:MAG: hypothetical protein AAGK17_11740 [Pseudomonadota bacterium]